MRRLQLITLVGLAGLVSLAGPRSTAWAGPRAYIVQTGDTLWELAEDNGCSIDQLRKANKLDASDPIVVGRELDLSACSGAKHSTAAATAGTTSQARYLVVSGDSLASIAQRHRTTVAELRKLNEIEGSLIRIGQELRVPGQSKRSVRLLVGQSRGRPGHGWLHQPTQLPQSSHYYRRRVERTWAAAHVIDHTVNAVHDARASFPKLHRLAIGDLSDKDGGSLSGHHSHQSGRDIDVGLYYRKVPVGYPNEFAVATKDSLDAAATWALLESFVRTAGREGGVEKVFLDYELQGWLYAAARKDGWSKAKLADVFQYPDGPYASHGIVRHEPKHDDHIHVRFSCTADDDGCK